MTFDEILDQVREMLQNKGRISYRALKRRFALDDEYLEDLKAELIKAEGVATDEDGEVLVWVGSGINGEKDKWINGGSEGEKAKREKGEKDKDSARRTLSSEPLAAERRQLTVMFCDLVDSTALSALLDPEELREVIRQYQETCTTVIQRYEGYIAQHLGDGLLVYFGYPVAHEDDARRAVRAGVEILAGLPPLNAQLAPAIRARLPHPVQIRIGIHTGLVVIGEIGSSEKREMLALGETPNVAARLQGWAEPDTIVISAVTQRLVVGLFECQALGPQTLKGVTAPMALYRVIREAEAQSRFEAAVRTGLTPLVGRDEELALLRHRWEQAKEGQGQVVLLSGEAGIGKSRLVQEMKERISAEGTTRIEFRCSSYHQNSAFYPILTHLQRLLQFAADDSPQLKLTKLRQALTHYRFPQTETLPLLAALLSLPQPDGVQPLTWSPQKQKEKTQEALVAWLMEEAARQVVYLVWEDLHWIDPSSLEVLTLILQQVPTSRALVVLTYRPDFTPPWSSRAHSMQLTLSRLGQQHVTAMVNQVMAKAVLSDEVIRQIVSRTDGIPLFVEEITKSVVESIGMHDRASLPSSAIPVTLHDSLMARLDRLGPAKEIAQLGATIGREFSYELLHAVSLVSDAALQYGLKQLVEVELVYQRGLIPHAHYLFKHALIQDTAYQSLLKSTRQQYHRQIAQVLETRFPEMVTAQPELVAYHYTEAGLTEQAIPYWQQSGERATQRSANLEAVSHLTKGLELLTTLADTPARDQQELALQLALTDVLFSIKGYTAPEVEEILLRTQALCQRLGETLQLFRVLLRMGLFHLIRAETQTAGELAEQLLRLAQSVQAPDLLSLAHTILGETLYVRGELTAAQSHLEQGIALYDPHKDLRYIYNVPDPRVECLAFLAWTLWFLGYPDQALQRSHESLALAEGLAYPFILTYASGFAAEFHLLRREVQLAQAQAEAALTLATEQGFPYYEAYGTIVRGSALATQGQVEEGIVQIQQGLAASRAIGAELLRLGCLPWLPAPYAQAGRAEEGLAVVAEALLLVDETGRREEEAELYRLKGELTLAQKSRKVGIAHQPVSIAEAVTVGCAHPTEESEAEACFLRAIEIAQKQQAKSLELRAVMSLVRLRQYQAQNHESPNTQHEIPNRLNEAHKMLSDVYNWFTEGFNTKDLQEAKELLEELS